MITGAVLALGASTAWGQAPASAPLPAPALPTNAGYLASNCANCHGTTGSAKGGMPSLAGQKKDFIVEQMKAFRDGKRPSTIMGQLAKGYTDAQIDMVADYFARQTPAR
jgi:cytochrome c553